MSVSAYNINEERDVLYLSQCRTKKHCLFKNASQCAAKKHCLFKKRFTMCGKETLFKSLWISKGFFERENK